MTLSARAERFCLLLLLLIFACFTAHGLLMFYSGDDMMNMYGAWIINPWRLWKSVPLLWVPVYRPLGAIVYRVFYSIFGFHNVPLYIFCWLILLYNVLLSYRLFRVLGSAIAPALIGVSLTLIHGNFQDLYLSAGTIYDRLCFLFTALGIIVYVRMKPSLARWLLTGLICVLSMTSKESGIALPVLLACYDVIFTLPDVWRAGRLKAWLGGVTPFYAALFVLSIVFIFRVNHTPELADTGAYHPRASLSLWLTHLGEYFAALVYRAKPFPPVIAAVVVIATALAAAAARNRLMLFGWIFFIIAITPVALISSRPGYVLYVPDLGLGLYAAGAFSLIPARSPRVQMALFLFITTAVTWFHWRNWPGPFPPDASPEKRFSEQFRHDYPKFPANTRLLFVSDDFPPASWDLAFNTWLLYHDRSIVVHRLDAPPDQQAPRGAALRYDHVFAVQDGRYIELDNRNIEESVRLHILRNYSLGREMDFGHADHGAYAISGVLDGDSAEPSRWIGPDAKFKFDLYPAPATFSAHFYVPDIVAKPPIRTLSVTVAGREIGRFPLLHDGIFDVRFPVAPSDITLNGFTIAELRVDHPYKNADGQEFGVVLMRAGFEYLNTNARTMQ